MKIEIPDEHMEEILFYLQSLRNWVVKTSWNQEDLRPEIMNLDDIINKIKESK